MCSFFISEGFFFSLMGDNVLVLPHRNLALPKCMRCDAGLIWQWWGMCKLRNDVYLMSIVPIEIIRVAIQKYKLHYRRGKRRLFCVFWGCLCQHSNTEFTWLKSCFSVKVCLEGEQWSGLPSSKAHLLPLAWASRCSTLGAQLCSHLSFMFWLWRWSASDASPSSLLLLLLLFICT